MRISLASETRRGIHYLAVQNAHAVRHNGAVDERSEGTGPGASGDRGTVPSGADHGFAVRRSSFLGRNLLLEFLNAPAIRKTNAARSH